MIFINYLVINFNYLYFEFNYSKIPTWITYYIDDIGTAVHG